ncbi:amidase (plasmid) [Tistrella bauzanensis]|uniref:amidase n=1 Tax=Tistrella TaxID=171436 RepID=UPI0031F69408
MANGLDASFAEPMPSDQVPRSAAPAATIDAATIDAATIDVGAALCRLDAGRLARMIATGETTATAVVQAALDRVAAVNPAVNAVVRVLADDALREAAEADRAVAEGRPLGPLHGVPVTTKINIDQRGLPTDNGVAAYRDLIAGADNPVIANLRDAGCIIIGRTNAPVYSMRWFTDNSLHGATLNPWSAAHTVGGSSGGAAASVATGMVPIAHGNDIAGSVRYPAYCCGLVGLKPSYGRVPSFNATAKGGGSIAAQLMAVQGPITRSVADAELAFTAMAVPHVDDPRARLVPSQMPPAPKRAALVAMNAWPDCHPAVAEAVASAGRALAAAGYEVEAVVPPALEDLADMWAEIAVPDILALLDPAIAASGDANIKTAVDLWRSCWWAYTPADGFAALARRHGLLRLWQRFLEDWPVVVMPTSLEPAFPRLADVQSKEMTARVLRAQAPMMVISVLGLPGLSVPTGLVSMPDAEGAGQRLPTGVQIVAGPDREDLCFAAGRLVEAAHAPFTPIDPVF